MACKKYYLDKGCDVGEKSFVSLSARVCVVCGATYEDGDLLLDKRLSNTLERTTVVGYGMCDEHEKLKNDGYVAIIETVDSSSKSETLRPSEANRTGRIIHLRGSVWPEIFSSPVPDKGVCFMEEHVFKGLVAMMPSEDATDEGAVDVPAGK